MIRYCHMNMKRFLQLAIVPLLLFINFYIFTNFPILKYLIFSGSHVNAVITTSALILVHAVILFLVYKKPKYQTVGQTTSTLIQKNNFLKEFFSFKTVIVVLVTVYIVDFAESVAFGSSYTAINTFFFHPLIFILLILTIWAGILFLITNRRK